MTTLFDRHRRIIWAHEYQFSFGSPAGAARPWRQNEPSPDSTRAALKARAEESFLPGGSCSVTSDRSPARRTWRPDPDPGQHLRPRVRGTCRLPHRRGNRFQPAKSIQVPDVDEGVGQRLEQAGERDGSVGSGVANGEGAVERRQREAGELVDPGGSSSSKAIEIWCAGLERRLADVPDDRGDVALGGLGRLDGEDDEEPQEARVALERLDRRATTTAAGRSAAGPRGRDRAGRRRTARRHAPSPPAGCPSLEP